MTDERAIELLCEMVTNCENDIPISGYVDPLRKEKARALDIAIEAIKEKMERNSVCVGAEEWEG